MANQLSIHDAAEIESLASRWGVDHRTLRRFRRVFYKKCLGAEQALLTLDAAAREEFRRAVTFHPLTLVDRRESARDGATKLVFRTARGLLVEAVILRIATGRVTLCVSSQVGCAAHCRFCATGQMGIAQDLTAAEIVDQVVQAGELLRAENRRIRNIVFMGMGEPLHNEEQLHVALELLSAPAAFNISLRRVIVSTVGIPDALARLAQRFPEVCSAVSLHSAREETRRRIIPLADKHSLAALREAMVSATSVAGRPIFVEYLLLQDLNDSDEDAAALVDYLAGVPVHINLIPYNPIDGAPDLVATDRAGQLRFADTLRRAGLTVTIRYSLGADIAAACGQLVKSENRRIAMAGR